MDRGTSLLPGLSLKATTPSVDNVDLVCTPLLAFVLSPLQPHAAVLLFVFAPRLSSVYKLCLENVMVHVQSR